MIVAGILTIALPIAGSIVGDILIAWLLAIMGMLHLGVALSTRPFKSFIWKVLLGVVYLVGGIWMALFPLAGLASLTLFVAALFFAEGIFEIIAFLAMHRVSGAGWLLLDGTVAIFLGVLVLAGWPASTLWAVGLLIGVNLLVSGLIRLTLFTPTRLPQAQ